MDRKKTKKEILNHLLKEGYQREEIVKVMAYLVGSGYKEVDEVIKYKVGPHTFLEFVKWMEEPEKKEMCKEIASALDYFIRCVKTTDQIKEKTWNQIAWLSENHEFIEKCIENKDKIERYLKITEPIQQETADRLDRMFKRFNSDLKRYLERMEEPGNFSYPH